MVETGESASADGAASLLSRLAHHRLLAHFAELLVRAVTTTMPAAGVRRGALDTKAVTVMQLEAIRLLLEAGGEPSRNIMILVTPIMIWNISNVRKEGA